MYNSKTGKILGCAGVFILALAAHLPAQDEGEKQPWLHAGIRLGVTGAVVDPAEFTASIRQLYPGDRSYFPLYSQIGVGLEQRVRLRFVPGWLVFQELILVSGLDQNFALPLLGLLFEYRFPFGLDIGLGPELTLGWLNGQVTMLPALMYTVGWHFTLDDFTIPIMLAVSPLPPDRNIRITLLSGFNHAVRIKLPKREKEKTPFNY